MDDARVLAALDRIDSLDRSRVRPAELLAELRGLLREAEALTRERQPAEVDDEEVSGRLGTAPARDIIAM
jgi:hypothetical protein